MIYSHELERWQRRIKCLLQEGLGSLEVLAGCRNLIFVIATVWVLCKVALCVVHEGGGGALVRGGVVEYLLGGLLDGNITWGLLVVVGAGHGPFFEVFALIRLKSLSGWVKATTRRFLWQFTSKVKGKEVARIITRSLARFSQRSRTLFVYTLFLCLSCWAHACAVLHH